LRCESNRPRRIYASHQRQQIRIEYHPETITDLNEAVEFYNRRQAQLGDNFREEVYSAISRIQANPLMFKQTEGFRRVLLKRFPYSVVFRIIDQQVIRILIIRHHRRRTEYGMYRQ
jgi:plasmid stabilization system protein ParE